MAGHGYKELLRAEVHKILRQEGVNDLPEDDQPLITSGLLDSLAVVDIASFMETSFGLDFSSTYFDQHDFETIDTMAHFVEKNTNAD